MNCQKTKPQTFVKQQLGPPIITPGGLLLQQHKRQIFLKNHLNIKIQKHPLQNHLPRWFCSTRNNKTHRGWNKPTQTSHEIKCNNKTSSRKTSRKPPDLGPQPKPSPLDANPKATHGTNSNLHPCKHWRGLPFAHGNWPGYPSTPQCWRDHYTMTIGFNSHHLNMD